MHGPISKEQVVNNKKKIDDCLQNTISRPNRTRRASSISKESPKKTLKRRPSSKKLPPLDDKAKESMNK